MTDPNPLVIDGGAAPVLRPFSDVEQVSGIKCVERGLIRGDKCMERECPEYQ
jgi:hypothetical protein